MPARVPLKNSDERDHAEERAGQHDELLGHDEHVADGDGLGADEGRERDVVAAAAPDLPRGAAEHVREADGRQHQADCGRPDERPIREPLGDEAERERPADGGDEGEHVGHVREHVQRVGEEPAQHEQLAVGEVHDPRRLVDDHEPDGHQRVEASRRQPADEEIREHATHQRWTGVTATSWILSPTSWIHAGVL